MPMKKRLIMWIALLLAAMIPFTALADTASDVSANPALSFSTTTLAGKKIDSSIMQKYDLILVNFWGEWCYWCLYEMPDLQKITQNYKNVLILGVWYGNSASDALATAKEKGVSYPLLHPDANLSKIMSSVSSWPTTYFYDKNGNEVRSRIVGAMDYNSWSSTISAVLASLPKTDPEPKATAPTISTQPKSATIKAGKTAKFKVKANGDGLTYQWYYRTSSKGSWLKVSKKGTSATCSVKVTAQMNGWQFRCLVKNSAGEIYTKTVKLKLKK